MFLTWLHKIWNLKPFQGTNYQLKEADSSKRWQDNSDAQYFGDFNQSVAAPLSSSPPGTPRPPFFFFYTQMGPDLSRTRRGRPQLVLAMLHT